jgi:hypothetical protein
MAQTNVGSPTGRETDLGDLLACGGEADLQAFDLAEPALVLGFADAVEQVGAHVGEPVALCGVGPQERAAQAGLTEMILS